jgi:hypothetical protein
MAENITIIRLEISETGSVSSNSGSSLTPGGVGAAAGVGAAVSMSRKGSLLNDVFAYAENPQARQSSKDMRWTAFKNSLSKFGDAYSYMKMDTTMSGQKIDLQTRLNTSKMLIGQGIKGAWNNRPISSKARLGAAGLAVAGYNIYSQYKTLGHNLSGASHSAQVQQRKAAVVNRGASLIGAAIVNPWLAVGMVAHRAWQLSQTNRRELFEIRKSQIISNVMQERLVKDTIQRRF